jgi:hypothetical protein
MRLALVFTDEDGAGFQAPVELRFLTAGESIEQLDCCSVEPAERLLLDAVSNQSRDEVLCQRSGRDCAILNQRAMSSPGPFFAGEGRVGALSRSRALRDLCFGIRSKRLGHLDPLDSFHGLNS